MMWVSGISPFEVASAFIGALFAFGVFGVVGAAQQHALSAARTQQEGVRIDWVRRFVVALLLADLRVTNFVVNGVFPGFEERVPALGLGLWVAICIDRASDSRSGRLFSPDPTALYFLQLHMSRGVADYAALTEGSEAVRLPNEFQRAEVRARFESTLRATAGSIRDVTVLTVNLETHSGEYDDTYGEFAFAIDDSSFIPFGRVFNRKVRTALTNGNDAQNWRLPRDRAAAVLQRNGNGRNVILVLQLSKCWQPRQPSMDSR